MESLIKAAHSVLLVISAAARPFTAAGEREASPPPLPRIDSPPPAGRAPEDLCPQRPAALFMAVVKIMNPPSVG